MIETERLILDKAKYDDWKELYENVWSHEETARYMLWDVTNSEAEARERIVRTIEYQKNNDGFIIYEKNTLRAIGFAGVRMISAEICDETGIALGPEFTHKGYGRETLRGLMNYAGRELGAKVFRASAREQNTASRKCILACGFKQIETAEKVDPGTGTPYGKCVYECQL